MSVPKGTRIGGRQKGTPNKRTQEVAEILARLGCDPFTGMATIALNQLPCGVCRGKGRTKYKVDGEVHERTCESCYGTLFEACSPELRGKMNAELAQYIAPKRKAIEMSGELGTPDLAAILRERFARRADH